MSSTGSDNGVPADPANRRVKPPSSQTASSKGSRSVGSSPQFLPIENLSSSLKDKHSPTNSSKTDSVAATSLNTAPTTPNNLSKPPGSKIASPMNLPSPLLLAKSPLVSSNNPSSSRKTHRILPSQRVSLSAITVERPGQPPKTPTSSANPNSFFSSSQTYSPQSSSSATSLASKVTARDPTIFSKHVRSQSSINLSSAMKEARDGQYRHSKMSSMSLVRPSTTSILHSELPSDGGSRQSSPKQRAFGMSPSATSTSNSASTSTDRSSRFKRGSFDLGDMPALKLAHSNVATSSQANNGMLAPPPLSFISRRKSGKKHEHTESHPDSQGNGDHHPLTSRQRSNSATSLLSIASINSASSSGSYEGSQSSKNSASFSHTPTNTHLTPSMANVSAVTSSVSSVSRTSSSDSLNLFSKSVTMVSGVSELKAHVASTLTSKISDSENGLKQQLISFETTLDDLKQLREQCAQMVSVFMNESEKSDTATQEKLKSLRDQMSAFKVLDSLETRISQAHTTIDIHKHKLDVVNKWVSLKEAESKLWRKRIKAARRIIVLSILFVFLAYFLFSNISKFRNKALPFKSSTASAQDRNFVRSIAMANPYPDMEQDPPLDEIVAYLDDINRC